jgi:GR25 family glycosyltransferase involved in LPS biosynthesis
MGEVTIMSLLQDSFASYVNLDERPDRRQKMEYFLRQARIDAVRTRGMLPSEYQGDRARVRVMQNRTPGAIGCHFSQVSIMERALREGKHAFVMEDDLVFCSDFHERLAHIERFVGTHEWDVIWFGGTFHVNPPWWHKAKGRDAELTDDPRMIRTYGAFSTHAYLVRRESIAKILALLDQQLDTTIGIDYSFIQVEPILHTYAFVPGCIKQYDNQSNIGKGETKFSNFCKLGPYWWQDKMTDFDPTTFNWHEAKV